MDRDYNTIFNGLEYVMQSDSAEVNLSDGNVNKSLDASQNVRANVRMRIGR